MVDKMLIEILQEINESRTEKGRGSKSGREKFSSKEGAKGSSVKSRKSRVKIYPSIKDALKSAAAYGTIFSTKSADRLYVITKPTWGAKSTAGGNARVAKGFTPGSATPNASWPSVKSHAVRTALKHGGSKSKALKRKYGPGTERPEERRYKGKTSKRKKKEQHKSSEAKKTDEANLSLREKIKYIAEVLSEMPLALAPLGALALMKPGGRKKLSAEEKKQRKRERQESEHQLKQATTHAATTRTRMGLAAGTEYEGPSLKEKVTHLVEKKKGGWIKGAAASIERRGTEGKCTPITKPGCTGRAKALAKTFKKIGKKRDKAIVSKKEKQAKGK